jgi:hypothetical protein
MYMPELQSQISELEKQVQTLKEQMEILMARTEAMAGHRHPVSLPCSEGRVSGATGPSSRPKKEAPLAAPAAGAPD